MPRWRTKRDDHQMTDFSKPLVCSPTPIPGLTLWDLPVHGDQRGWFKENWQRAKMVQAGLPDFNPVQNNVSYNHSAGTTRGIHAEPWDKFVSVASGRIFGVWVDLREGPSFGSTFTAELDPSKAVFVPRGVGNAFQTLEPATTYIYLVNDHFSLDADYTSVDLTDEDLGIAWPIPLTAATMSLKDMNHPKLADVKPISPRKTLVLGASGQLGKGLRKHFNSDTRVEFADKRLIDISSDNLPDVVNWRSFDVVINAAAYTNVDSAESAEGREAAWLANATSCSRLAKIATRYGITLVHLSTDYVFDGNLNRPYNEDDHKCPVGTYGQTKAAAEDIVATVSRHYIVRTSWVIGDGANFVRTMLSLARRGISPEVVDDQVGRLTFTSDLSAAIHHLLEKRPPYGIYNVTGSGEPMTWASIARAAFEFAGHDPNRVKGISTAQYTSTLRRISAPRPKNSVLDLRKISGTGFLPEDHLRSLRHYVRAEPDVTGTGVRSE